ncbi:MAG: hypothetical protein ACR2NN_08465 [Bryobacteraceae bacterium]
MSHSRACVCVFCIVGVPLARNQVLRESRKHPATRSKNGGLGPDAAENFRAEHSEHEPEMVTVKPVTVDRLKRTCSLQRHADVN